MRAPAVVACIRVDSGHSQLAPSWGSIELGLHDLTPDNVADTSPWCTQRHKIQVSRRGWCQPRARKERALLFPRGHHLSPGELLAHRWPEDRNLPDLKKR